METEKITFLDEATIEFFAAKGTKNNKPRTDNPNGYKVRRVMQVIQDLSVKEWKDLYILDLACGEGVYSIEAGLHGAFVKGLDARMERMTGGIDIAARYDLRNVHFMQADIRDICVAWKKYDVVLCLGILYHLAWKDIIMVLKSIYNICGRMLVIDTHVAMNRTDTRVEYNDKPYFGYMYREHEDNASEDARRDKQLSSIDNTFSFWLTEESLLNLLHEIGFTSVYEVRIPAEPDKPGDRITLVAIKGEPVEISTYPWVNGK